VTNGNPSVASRREFVTKGKASVANWNEIVTT
jgi:hypothetical protein